MRNWLLAVLLIVPTIVTWVLEAITADVSTGKFCRLLAPVSPSPASLVVTPSFLRSIPRPVFEKIEFPRIALPVEVAGLIWIPSSAL